MHSYTIRKTLDNLFLDELKTIKPKLKNQKILSILKNSENKNNIDYISSSHNKINIRREKEKILNKTFKAGNEYVTHLLPIDTVTLATASTSSIKLWKVSTQECLASYSCHTTAIRCLIKIDNLHIASSCKDSVIIWNIETGIHKIRKFQDEIKLILYFDINKIIIQFTNSSGLYETESLECLKHFKTLNYTNLMVKVNKQIFPQFI
jgi:WD40 repeat protein